MGMARPVALGKVYIWGIPGVPGQRVVMPEGLGESGPTPLPRAGLPEGSIAGDYAETPWRPRSPAVRPLPHCGRKT